MLPKGWVWGEPSKQAELITEMVWRTNSAKKMKRGRPYSWCWLSTQETLESRGSLWGLSYYLLTTCICSCMCTLYYQMWRSKDKWQKFFPATIWVMGLKCLRPGGKHLYPLSPLTVPGLLWLSLPSSGGEVSWDEGSLAGASTVPFGILDYTNGGGHWRAASIGILCRLTTMPYGWMLQAPAPRLPNHAGLCTGSARKGYFPLTLLWTEYLLN